MANFPPDSGSDSSDSPGDVTSGVRFGMPVNYCSLGMRPHVMTGVLVQILRQHFADRQNVEDPAFRGSVDDPRGEFLWRVEDPTGIVIESITRWDKTLAMKRPAIVVRRDAWRPLQLGINNEHMGLASGDGNPVFSQFWRGGHTLFCLTTAAAEAERLGAEVYREIGQFGPLIRKMLDLKKFQLAGLDRLHNLEEADGGGYAVPVSVAYASEDVWTLRQHAPKLKRIFLSTMP